MNSRTSADLTVESNLTVSFGRAADRYARFARVQDDLAGWLSEWLPMPRGGRALEIGAGPGLFTRRLLPWPGSLVATDFARAMCEAGRAAVPEATWRVMSAETPFRGPWDWIFSSSMMQWVGDPSAVLAAWRGQLAADGRLLAGWFVADTLPELRAVLEGTGPVRWRSVDTWRNEIARSGLRIVRDQAERRLFSYGSALELVQSLHGIGAAPERRMTSARLRNALREYERRFPTPGGVRATWTFYRVEAAR